MLVDSCLYEWLVVDYDLLFAAHNGDGYNVEFITESPSAGPLVSQVGRVSLDGAKQIVDTSKRQTLQDVHNLKYGS